MSKFWEKLPVRAFHYHKGGSNPKTPTLFMKLKLFK